MENSWIAGWNHWMEPHLIATLKAEETLFSLLRQIQKHLMFFVYVLQKLRHFFIKFLNCPGLPVVPNIRSCGQMDLLSIKLDDCLPLAYPSTIYKHFSSLMTFAKQSSFPATLNWRDSNLVPGKLISDMATSEPSRNHSTFNSSSFNLEKSWGIVGQGSLSFYTRSHSNWALCDKWGALIR